MIARGACLWPRTPRRMERRVSWCRSWSALSIFSSFAFAAILAGIAAVACGSVRLHTRPDSCPAHDFFYSDEFCSLQGACHEVGDGKCYARCSHDSDCHDRVLLSADV